MIKIIDFESRYAEDFKNLNEAWIKKYFKIEQSDIDALHHAQTYIIDKGGFVFFAQYNDKIVGACALIKSENGTYELAKMAVHEDYQGLKIGYLIGKHCVDFAKSIGATRVYLESNRRLIPALTLYKKLGFLEVENFVTPYERADIAMEIVF